MQNKGVAETYDVFGNKVAGTSVKVHHAPGGASSFSLGGGYGGEGSVLDGKKNQAGGAVGATAAGATEEKKEEAQPTGAAAVPGGQDDGIRRVQPGTSETFDVFGNKVSGTSIKVHAPPGGKSSITF